jgi:hypothetical protein
LDKNIITVLDGSKEEREKIMKKFFGLAPEQSFQDLEVEEEKEN